jgi:enamine deaminase RidA (YjgF/YER057c/UK114 family)
MANAKGSVQYLNPDTLSSNPAFTNVVVVSGNVKTIYVGGQNAVDNKGQIVGKGDIAAQTEQILKNIQAALAAADASLEHVIRWNMYILQGQSLQEGFGAFQKVWGKKPNPPAISMAFVSGLANPDYLAEIDVVAVVPE